MHPRSSLLVRVGPVAVAIALVSGAAMGPFAASAGATTTAFDSEAPAGTPYKHQSNWEPTVAVDPSNANVVYQLITGINAHECAPRCPGTSVLFRRSTDGGDTWGQQTFVCGLACKGVGWQYDPQIKVATNGTIYVAFLNTFNATFAS